MSNLSRKVRRFEDRNADISTLLPSTKKQRYSRRTYRAPSPDRMQEIRDAQANIASKENASALQAAHRGGAMPIKRLLRKHRPGRVSVAYAARQKKMGRTVKVQIQ